MTIAILDTFYHPPACGGSACIILCTWKLRKIDLAYAALFIVRIWGGPDGLHDACSI